MRRRIGAITALAVVVLLSVVGWAPPAGAGEVTLDEPVARLLVLSVPTLSWEDLEAADMPNLEALLAESAVADLSTRAVDRRTTPGDAYATISAGTRADGVRDEDGLGFEVGERYQGDTGGRGLRSPNRADRGRGARLVGRAEARAGERRAGLRCRGRGVGRRHRRCRLPERGGRQRRRGRAAARGGLRPGGRHLAHGSGRHGAGRVGRPRAAAARTPSPRSANATTTRSSPMPRSRRGSIGPCSWWRHPTSFGPTSTGRRPATGNGGCSGTRRWPTPTT